MQKTYPTAIQTENVTHVLLSDGWHKVGRILRDEPDSSLSFMLDSFLFNDEEQGLSKSVDGFSFIDERTGLEVHGPLASIQCVQVVGLYEPETRIARWLRLTGYRLRRLALRPAGATCLLFAALLASLR